MAKLGQQCDTERTLTVYYSSKYDRLSKVEVNIKLDVAALNVIAWLS